MQILDLRQIEPKEPERVPWFDYIGGFFALLAIGWFLFFFLPNVLPN